MADTERRSSTKFTSTPYGSIVDSTTNLEWLPAPDCDFTWEEANQYAQSLSMGGKNDWHLPSCDELRSICDPEIKSDFFGGGGGIDPVFNLFESADTAETDVWSSKLFTPSYGCFFSFSTEDGCEGGSDTSHRMRVLVVRTTE